MPTLKDMLEESMLYLSLLNMAGLPARYLECYSKIIVKLYLYLRFFNEEKYREYTEKFLRSIINVAEKYGDEDLKAKFEDLLSKVRYASVDARKMMNWVAMEVFLKTILSAAKKI